MGIGVALQRAVIGLVIATAPAATLVVAGEPMRSAPTAPAAADKPADIEATLFELLRTLGGLEDTDAQRTARATVDAAVDRAAPVLERWIVTSRDRALADGTQPIPGAVRERLLGYFPASLLDRVRYRTGLADDTSLQGTVFHFNNTKAITLGDVIIFRDAAAAADPVFWAHELVHVQQYDALGIPGFARAYVRDFRGMEMEAWTATSHYTIWALQHGKMTRAELDTFGRF